MTDTVSTPRRLSSVSRRTALASLISACVALPLAPALAENAAGDAALAPPRGPFEPEVPESVSADVRLAAYASNSADPGDYGNYSLASRTKNDVSAIIIHDTEVDYETTLSIFQNSSRYASIHYVIREDGHVTQMVRGKDVAWHAGNWTFNQSSIGIELIGVAEEPEHYTPEQYAATGALVHYLAERWDIPLDRDHVLAHEDLPGGSPKGQSAMHWDPGAYYNWRALMHEAGMDTPTSSPRTLKDTVTIAPRYESNTIAFLSCNEGGGRLPARPTSQLFVRTAPSEDAPLLDDPALAEFTPSGGTERICDWGAQVSYGQTYAVAETRKDWVAIWISGTVGWIHRRNAEGHPTVARGPKSATLVEAREPNTPVFGSAYPAPEAFAAAGVSAPAVTPLPYTLQPGQRYVLEAENTGAYYASPDFDGTGGAWVRDDTTWLRIQLNHRSAFVLASAVRTA